MDRERERDAQKEPRNKVTIRNLLGQLPTLRHGGLPHHWYPADGLQPCRSVSPPGSTSSSPEWFLRVSSKLVRGAGTIISNLEGGCTHIVYTLVVV